MYMPNNIPNHQIYIHPFIYNVHSDQTTKLIRDSVEHIPHVYCTTLQVVVQLNAFITPLRLHAVDHFMT